MPVASEVAAKVAKKAGKQTFNSGKFAKKYGINIIVEKRATRPVYMVPFGNAGRFVDVFMTRRTVPKECSKLALTFCMPWGGPEMPPTQHVIRYVRKIARTFKKADTWARANDYDYTSRRVQGRHEQSWLNAYNRVFNIVPRPAQAGRRNPELESRRELSILKQGEKIQEYFGKCFTDLVSD